MYIWIFFFKMVHRFVGIYLSDQVLVFQRVDNTIYRINHNLVHFVESYAVLITFCHFILIYLVNSITHPLINQDRCWKSFVIINKLIAIDILFKETKPGLVFVSLHFSDIYFYSLNSQRVSRARIQYSVAGYTPQVWLDCFASEWY